MDSKVPDRDNPQVPGGAYKWAFMPKDQSLEHTGIPEWIRMNRYHLVLVVERLKKGSKIPSYSDVWPWVFTFFAFLLAVSTTDCKAFLGVPAGTWQAIFIIATVLSFGVTVYTLWQAFIHRKERSKTPEEEVDEIIEKLEEDREKLAKS